METLDQIVEKFSGSSEFLHSLEESDIPSLREAAKDKWKMAVKNADLLLLKTVEFYLEDDRKRDAQRVIPLSTALSVIREMEELLIAKTVLDPIDIYQSTLATKWRAIQFWQSGLFNVQNWFRTYKILRDIATNSNVAMIKIFLYIFEISSAATIGKTVGKVLLQREFHERKMRKRALPVPTGKVRYPRRKVAR